MILYDTVTVSKLSASLPEESRRNRKESSFTDDQGGERFKSADDSN